MDFKIFRDESGEWRWLLAEGATSFLASRGGFPTEQACRNSVAAVRQQILVAPAVRLGAAAPGRIAVS